MPYLVPVPLLVPGLHLLPGLHLVLGRPGFTSVFPPSSIWLCLVAGVPHFIFVLFSDASFSESSDIIIIW